MSARQVIRIYTYFLGASLWKVLYPEIRLDEEEHVVPQTAAR